MQKMNNEKIKAARHELGSFFKARREDLGHNLETVADHIGISANTLNGVESGRFAWDIDLHLRICQALAIKPYFSFLQQEGEEDYTLRSNDDPERYHGYYISQNLSLYPDQMALTKLTPPMLFVRFNYADSVHSSFEDWKANLTDLQWLNPNDRPDTLDEINDFLIDCWNFLALEERVEENYQDDDNS